ncbi:hypothetical protein AM404_28930 (plasmid) [Klebsiella pneumoniae]|nr:hypothetical protein AM404_28930 [Klebsiella pneumoniae]
MALAVSHPMMLPSVNSTTSAPGNLIYISWLNGWPVNTPVNASPHTSRYATHDSGTLWIAGPSMVGDFHPLISTGLPAHTVFITSIVTLFFFKSRQNVGNDSNLLIVFYVQIMPDDFVMQLHRF